MASGVLYDEFIRTRLLAPLGLTRTGFNADEFDQENLAVGYRHGLGGWAEAPFDPYGAFAPMGGVFSTVSDLARWVARFAAAFPPDGDAGQATASATHAHPLRPGSRRQMQLPQAVTGWRAAGRLPGGPPALPSTTGSACSSTRTRRSGGWSRTAADPGFGSNMRWHPATGIGVIALGNGTYAPMSPLTGLVLDALVPSSSAYQVALAPAATASRQAGAPWPQTLEAQEKVDRLLADWDDAAADGLFTENVALDAPYNERRHTIGLIRERIGDFTADPNRAAESDTPAHRRWWLTGKNGTVQAQIQLSPERAPRVMSVTLAVPPASHPSLARALDAVLQWLNDPAQDWPSSVPVAASADAGLIARRLRMVAAWAGKCAVGAFQAGSGTASSTVEPVGEHATITLSLLVNRATGELRQADVTL